MARTQFVTFLPARAMHALAALLLAALAALPLALNPYQQYVVNLIFVYVPIAIGFNIVIGNLGQLAFSSVAYFGIGAYTSLILSVHLGMPWWLTLPFSAVFTGFFAMIVSLAALRGLRSFYLAIVTLAFGELMRWSYIHAEALTGGATGLRMPPIDVFGWILKTDQQKYFVILVVSLATVVATRRLLRSRFGRAFVAIKNNELAAAAMGIDTSRYFVLGFIWNGVLVGIAGALYAALVGYITPEAFGLPEMLLQVAIVTVGGLGSLAGSVLGAVAITTLPELVRSYAGLLEIALGLSVILVILFLPGGLVQVLTWATGYRERYSEE